MAKTKPKNRPATTDEGRENQLISLAYDEAERMMREHTAPAQIVTQLLRAGSVREKLEKERLIEENELLRAKVETLASQKRIEDLYADAMEAFARYSGSGVTTMEDVDVGD